MANPLSFDIDADGEKARQELRKLARDNANLREEVRKLADESRRSSDDQESSLEKAGKSLKNYAAGWVSVQTAMAGAKATLTDIMDQQERARDAMQTFGESLSGAIRNLPKDVSGDQLERDILKLSRDTNTPANELAQGMETLLSASSGNYERSLKTLDAAARAVPFGADSRALVGGASLDLLKTAPPGTSEEAAVGQIIAAGAQARTTDIGQFASNVVSGVASLNKYGGDAQENLAILAAMTSGSADKTGASSASAAIALAEQARAFGIKGDPLEQIRTLQQNAELRKNFLDFASFEKKQLATVRGLLQPGSSDAVALDQSLLAIPDIQNGAASLELLEKSYRSSESVEFARIGRASDAANEAAYIANSPNAIIAQARKTVEDAQAAAGANVLEREFDKYSNMAISQIQSKRTGVPLDDMSVIVAKETLRETRNYLNAEPGSPADIALTEGNRILERLLQAAEANNALLSNMQGHQSSLPKYQPVAPNMGLER